jgi:hypothetical protein
MHFVNLIALARKFFSSSGVAAVPVAIGASSKNGFSKLLGILTMLIVAINASVSTAGTIFVLNGSSFAPSNPSFGSIDVSTGAYTEIVSALPKEFMRNLVWNSSISAFYTIDGDADAQPVVLSKIDTSGSITPIGSLNSSRTVTGMAYRQSDSTIYGYDKDGSDYGTINPVSGAWSNLRTAGHGIPDFGNTGGRFAIHNETLYLTGESGTDGVFGTIGYTASSAFTQIGGTSNVFINMVLASDGTNLFGIFGDGTAGNQTLYSIDPATGTPSHISAITGSGLGSHFYGAAFQPNSQPVPEPSMGVISLFGMACVGFARRIKAKRVDRS